MSLIEVMVALLMVVMAAMLLARISSANAAARAQARTHSVVVRFAAELAEWTRRGGHLPLGSPLPAALAAADGGAPEADCSDAGCDAREAAWHFLASWQARVREALPSVRLHACADRWPGVAPGWDCEPGGPVPVLKIAAHGSDVPVVLVLGQ